jgi:hypothetical protein
MLIPRILLKTSHKDECLDNEKYCKDSIATAKSIPMNRTKANDTVEDPYRFLKTA